MNLTGIGRGIVWFAIGAATVAVPILLLQHEAVLPRDPVTIRSYHVAPEIAGEIKGALQEAFFGNASWQVSRPVDGLLLVNAPDSVQTAVQGILAEVGAKKPPPTPAIHFEVWLVATRVDTAGTPSDAAGLAEIRPALAGIEKSQGPLHFGLVEKLALQARAGNEDNQINGSHFGMRLTPTMRQDAKGDPVITAKISVHAYIPNCGGSNCPGSLNVLAEFPPGQLLVIGQSGLPGQPNAERTPEQAVYYIVRASL
jgi:hypothetical protein